MWHSVIVMTSGESVKVANGRWPAYSVTLGVQAPSALATAESGLLDRHLTWVRTTECAVAPSVRGLSNKLSERMQMRAIRPTVEVDNPHNERAT